MFYKDDSCFYSQASVDYLINRENQIAKLKMNSQKTFGQKSSLLSTVFTPSTPVSVKDLFFGREYQISRIVEALDDRGKHVVLYGERGVGKTSLANWIELGAGKLTSKITCNRNEDFLSLWQRAIRKISIPLEHKDSPSNELDAVLSSWEALFEYSELNPSMLVDELAKVEIPIVFIFDEFDSIDDVDVKEAFADTLKAMSDSAPDITVIAVGIADNVSELTGAHPSIERCAALVKVPIMSNDDLGKIIDNGFNTLEMAIDSQVRQQIILLSQGFPHYTHLLSRNSAKSALMNESNHVNQSHFLVAVDDSVSDAYETVKEAHREAVASTSPESEKMFKQVILACATVSTNEYGDFRAADLQGPLSDISGDSIKFQKYTYYLGKLCSEERGGAIKKQGEKGRRKYCFRNPMLKAFVILKAFQEKHPEIQNIVLKYLN